MSDLPFTLDQLRILHAISNEGSFKKAAEKLYISQPAVSLQVQNLEKRGYGTFFNNNLAFANASLANYKHNLAFASTRPATNQHTRAFASRSHAHYNKTWPDDSMTV